jgi:ribosomal protein S12 methylthiotransferase
MKERFYLLPLGCPKNEADSDALASCLMAHGWSRTEHPVDARAVILTTCAFIRPAVEEAIETLFELSDLKEGGRKLVVAGCLVSRYGKSNLEKLLPEVDLFADFRDYQNLPAMLDGARDRGLAETPRTFSSTLGRGYVYIKLAEGCDRRCSFCTIPSIRGSLASRPWEDIRDEARFFVAKGARELVLVAQDTTSYGVDLYGRPSLPLLMERLLELDGDYRLRVMYMHPEGIDRSILDCMEDPRVCSYLDIPFQHVDRNILRGMGRKGGERSHDRLLDEIRGRLGEVYLRATFMTGFPGEDGESFKKLAAFIAAQRFDWLGLFSYSQEEGTRASCMENTVHPRLARRRLDRLAEMQDEIMRDKARSLIGKSFQVLVEGMSQEAPGYWEARSAREAPEVDGVIFIADHPSLTPGSFYETIVTGSEGIDLIGSLIIEDGSENGAGDSK